VYDFSEALTWRQELEVVPEVGVWVDGSDGIRVSNGSKLVILPHISDLSMEPDTEDHVAFISSLCPQYTESFEQFEVQNEPLKKEDAVLAPIPPASFPVTAKESSSVQAAQCPNEEQSNITTCGSDK
jgi:hypothetical protein